MPQRAGAPPAPHFGLPIHAKARVTRARKRLGVEKGCTLAQVRRAFLAARWRRAACDGHHEHELSVLNAYLVLKAALAGAPLPTRLATTRHGARYRPPKPDAPETPPMLAAAFGCLHEWAWGERGRRFP